MATAIEQITNGVHFLAPELILVLAVCVMFLAGPFFVTEAGVGASGLRQRWGALALAAIGCAGFFWWNADSPPLDTGPFRADALTWYVRGLTLALGAIISSSWSIRSTTATRPKRTPACLAILAGVNLTALANDLVVLFLALELVSIPTYVLLYLPRRGEANQEATIKYFLLSVFSSAIVLYGMSLLFGAAGTTNLAGIAETFADGMSEDSTTLDAARRSRCWSPGCRSASPPCRSTSTPRTCSRGPVRRRRPCCRSCRRWSASWPCCGCCRWSAASEWPRLSTARRPASCSPLWRSRRCSLGNLLALRQDNLYRLLAYSSVAHAGYMLIGLAVEERTATSAASAPCCSTWPPTA